jgi:hypothetical protein
VHGREELEGPAPARGGGGALSPEDEALLAEMRTHYEFATLEGHVLVGGELFRRCRRCRERPVPRTASFVDLCDPCLDAQTEENARARGARR